MNGLDECGIYQTGSSISYTSLPGNSQDNNSRNFNGGPITSSNIRTDCPNRRHTGRPGSITEQDRSALGIINFQGPSHSLYITEQERLKTFSSWPPALPQKPKELAEAGFFYTGRSDQVKCFYCDGGLESFEPTDSPWGEHQKWFPECAFVKMKTEPTEIVEQKMKKKFDEHTHLYSKDSIKEQMPKTIEPTVSTGQTCPSKVESWQKEIERLQEARNCKICMENEASIVFLPCGHLCSCTSCAPALKTCAVCRTPIRGLVRTYMA